MSPRSPLRMAEETAEETVTSAESEMRQRGVDARRKSFFSRFWASESCTGLCWGSACALARHGLGFPGPPAVAHSVRVCRNLSEEKLNQKTFYDIENRGELLVAPDRADEWGEELTEMGKWQRTNVRPPPPASVRAHARVCRRGHCDSSEKECIL